jgi:molybdenum cofactor synthesis domain-containing protein
VVTVSDGVSAGTRQDASGDVLEAILTARGFQVSRVLVPDEVVEISRAITEAAATAALVVTTGGTGLGPRDVTPEATASVLDRETPGLVHLMLSAGLESTPMAALSRSRAGAVGKSLVVNLPGSPRGAEESLLAVMEVVPHALKLLAGDTAHH